MPFYPHPTVTHFPVASVSSARNAGERGRRGGCMPLFAWLLAVPPTTSTKIGFIAWERCATIVSHYRGFEREGKWNIQSEILHPPSILSCVVSGQRRRMRVSC